MSREEEGHKGPQDGCQGEAATPGDYEKKMKHLEFPTEARISGRDIWIKDKINEIVDAINGIRAVIAEHTIKENGHLKEDSKLDRPVYIENDIA